ncbi:hypothetical protein JCM33374_g2394 [Metschnikowia sp. JCM 33374]|nr:hypothetical protein JCM33374_g2394 [Metschnikowia sp. JCM 33374]
MLFTWIFCCPVIEAIKDRKRIARVIRAEGGSRTSATTLKYTPQFSKAWMDYGLLEGQSLPEPNGQISQIAQKSSPEFGVCSWQ